MSENTAGAEELIAGRYKVIQTLGAGGMGVVYRALDTVLNKEVALKTLRGVSFSPEQILRFQTEAVALSNLKHPSIVEVMVFGLTDDNVPYLVMNFVEGMSLDKLIRSRGYLPVYKSVNLFIQLCDGLAHAHKHGVLHRDLKPANVMVCDPDSLHPKPVVVDFGIARIEGSTTNQNLTRPGAIIGTPTYMSPEQLRGGLIDARSDVYSVGCIMYESLTGNRPYEGDNELETMAKKLEGESPRLCDAMLDTDFPSALEMIVEKALHADPDQRFQSMDELKDALVSLKAGEFTSDAPVERRRQPPPQPSPNKPKKEISPKLVFLITALISGLVCFGCFFYQFLQPPKRVPIRSTTERFARTAKEANSFMAGIDVVRFKIETTSRGMAVDVSSPVVEADMTEENLIEKLKKKKARDVFTLLIGNIPITGQRFFTEFKDWPLETVILRGTKIDNEGVVALTKIRTIRSIRLEENPQLSKASLSLFATLPSIDSIGLVDCGIDMDKLKALPLRRLIYLDVYKNKDFDRECLKYVISSCPRLNSLDVSNTAITAKDFPLFASIKRLSMLGLRYMHLTNGDLNEIPNLQGLQRILLAGNFEIDDTGLVSLLRFRKLQDFGIFETSVTKLGMSEILRKRPNAIFHQAE